MIPGLGRSLEKGMATHSISLAWRILWQRSLVGYSPCGCKELDMTKHSTRELNDLLNLLYSVQGKFLPIQICQWLPILLYIKCYIIFQWYIKSYRCCSLAIFLKFEFSILLIVLQAHYLLGNLLTQLWTPIPKLYA